MPYGTLTRYNPGANRYRRYARYGVTAYRAARTISRYWRKRKGRYMANRRKKGRYTRLAEYQRKSRVKAPESLLTSQNLGLASLQVTPINIADKSLDLEDRTNIAVRLSGIKICETWTHQFNGDEAFGSTLDCHWALCQLKSPLDGTSNVTISLDIRQYIEGDFFRGSSNKLDRERSFLQPGPNSLWQYYHNCLPLNTERFNVLTHKKFTLTAQSTNSVATGAWFHKIDKYFPIRRNFVFKENADNFGKLPFFIVRWCNTVSRQDYPSDPTTNTPVVWHLRHKTYYRDG